MEQNEPVMKNVPSEEVIRQYFEFIIRAGILERFTEAEQKKEEKQ